MVVTLLGGCATSSASMTAAPDSSASPPVPQTSEAISVPSQVMAVAPALKAVIPSGISADLVSYVRATAGVAAAARISIDNLSIRTDRGTSSISVAGVDPTEFRPLAPDITAQAPFVWRGLARSEIFLAHEEHQRVGAEPGSVVFAQVRDKTLALRLGGVAANGIPNIAGGLISLSRASLLGLGEPTILLIGIDDPSHFTQVRTALRKLIMGVDFQDVRPLGRRAFLTGSAASRALGSFSFTANSDGSINQDPLWVKRNIVNAKVPILGTVSCHRAMIRQFSSALAEVERSGLAGTIEPKQYGGCYVPRFIGHDEAKGLSMHAWGLAADLNVSTNLQGNRPTIDPRVVQIFQRWGFRWGGDWSVPDGMHFELGALLR